MVIVAYPKTSTERFGQININTDASKFGSGKSSGKFINFKKGPKLISNGFQGLSFPELNRKVVKLYPNSCRGKLSKCGLEERLPRRELQDNSVDRPRSIKKKALHCFLRRTTNKKEAIGKIRYRNFTEGTPFSKKISFDFGERGGLAEELPIKSMLELQTGSVQRITIKFDES